MEQMTEDRELEGQEELLEGNEEGLMEAADDTRPIAIESSDPSDQMEKERKIVAELTGKFGKWDSWRKPFENVWDEIYRIYFSDVGNSKTASRSRVTVPIGFQLVESALPKIINVIFSSNEEFFEVVPTNAMDQDIAATIELLLNYQLGQADFFVKFVDFTKQLLMYGTSYFKVYWKVKRKWVWERTPIRQPMTILGFNLGDKITGWKTTKSYKVVERRPEVDVLDILDVFPDPEATNEKSCDGVFIQSWMNMNEFKELGKGKYPVYGNVDSPDISPDKSTFTSSRHARYSARGTSTPMSVDSNQVHLLEYWGYYDLDGDGIKEECCLVIANKKVLVRAIANPFDHQKKPLVKSTLFSVPMEWYGVGLIEPVIANIHELWTIRRQRLDNVNMILNRMWMVNSVADVDMDTLISSPNNTIITDDMAAVQPLDTPNVTTDAYNESAQILNDIKDAVLPDSAMGTPNNGNLGRTARGAQLIVGQALEKFGTVIKFVEETAVKRVLRMFHQLNLQFIDDDDILREKGFYGHLFDAEITPEDIRAEVEFKMVAISDMVNKEGKINQITSFMGIFGKVLSGDTISTLAKKVWKLMGFNPDEVNLQGMPGTGVQGNVVDNNMSQALMGQAGNQGTSAPTAVPGVQSGPK